MDRQPNLLVIHTDQQSSWTLGAYGGRVIGTPHTDRLAREGALFENFFINSAVCTPSRGCFLTGLYPHAHGAWHNELAMRPGVRTFADVLRDAGYDTGYIGKWHLDGLPSPEPAWKPNNWVPEGTLPPRPGWVPPERSRGFTDCRRMFHCSHGKGVVEQPDGPPQFSADPAAGRYMTDWLADEAIAFLSRPRTAPFCLMVSIPDPHEPYTVREPYASLFRPEDMPIPPTFRESGAPSWAQNNLEGCGSCRAQPDAEAALRRTRATYCGQVKCIDDNVGRLLAWLEGNRRLDDTIVVFTTDHGDYMGEHGLVGKNRCFEAVYRVPLLVRWPAAIRPGARIDRFVTTVDFMPTILRLMGLPAAACCQGRDASPLLRGQAPAWADEAFFHHSHFDFAGIFTPEWELALWHGGEHALWNRREDPDQTANRVDDPACRAIRDDLLRRVLEHNRSVGSPAAEWVETFQTEAP